MQPRRSQVEDPFMIKRCRPTMQRLALALSLLAM
jgi:hypothetical protein